MTGTFNRRSLLAAAATVPVALQLPAVARAAGAAPAPNPVDAAAVDALVTNFMSRFDIPGVSIAIVTPGAPPLVRGYGVRELGKPGRVDEHTRFGIASNSKAFTAAAIAMLVDEGKVEWDAPVTRYLPEFRMNDPAVTQMMTVRDLLVHRSGLPLGAGDLMSFPASNHVAADALKALPYLKAERGFRAGYAYDNILYIVAGLLIERVSGQGWREFIATRILTPAGMADAVPARDLLRTDNVAGRHARLGPPVRGLGPVAVVAPDETPMIDAAGGINASATDIARWLQLQLDQGVLPGGRRLWSEARAVDMWTPQTIVATSDGPTAEQPTRPVTSAYALGWFVADYRGERLISHSGGLTGQITQTAMLPSRRIGVAVFTNTEDRVSAELRNALLDLVIAAPAHDWAATWAERVKRNAALATAGPGVQKPPAGVPSLPLARYAGRYRDPWYGEIEVRQAGAGLAINFLPSPTLRGPLEPWGADTFRTRFAPDGPEDAVVHFHVQDGRVAKVTMKALSPLADFSFDYHHLEFEPVPAPGG